MRDAALTDRQKTEKGLDGSYAPRVRGRVVIAQWKDVSWTRRKGGAAMNSKIVVQGSAMLVLVAALLGVVGPAVPPASAEIKRGTTGKTAKQCDTDRRACETKCVKTLIDVDDAIKNCKEDCFVLFANCTPNRRSTETSPLIQTAPILQFRGVEGAAPAGKEDKAPASK